MLHPGAAGQGGSTTAIIADFKAALRKIEEWAADDPAWLPTDPGGERKSADCATVQELPRSRSATFPTATRWRLGRGGTSSNRQDAQRSIQIFSDDGHYNGHVGPLLVDGRRHQGGVRGRPGRSALRTAEDKLADHDLGPPPAFARLLQGRSQDSRGLTSATGRRVASLVRLRTDPPRPAGRCARHRAGRPGVARRSVLLSRHDRRCRPALPGVSPGDGHHEELSDSPCPARRHPRSHRHPCKRDRRRRAGASALSRHRRARLDDGRDGAGARRRPGRDATRPSCSAGRSSQGGA